jgi:transposase, IS5 family
MAHRSKVNEEFLAKNGFVSRIHRKKPPRRPMPRRCGAPMRSSPRPAHASSRSSRCRKIGMANIVYSVKRLVFLGRLAAA